MCRTTRATLQAAALMLLVASATTGQEPSEEPPVIPVGLDAYRMWDRWPYQRIGVRAYMRSTYDRRGGNESADASHFLYQLADDYNVTLDVAGSGVLYFARYNHWHGSPWHYEVDELDHIVRETSTADPLNPTPGSVFLPQHLFPNPLTWTWSHTKGADLMWVPIGFEKSFRMAYSRTFYGTGYYIYHQFVDGARLSQPITRWDGKTPPKDDVLDLLRRAGTDIAPQPGRAGVREESGRIDLPATGSHEVWRSTRAPSMLRALEFSVPREQALAFSRARLRVTWDDRSDASIDAPISLFYGAGVLYNRDNREHLVKGLPMVIRYDTDQVHLSCYFPMPFFRSARIELSGPGRTAIPNVTWRVRYAPYTDPPNHVGYFHATSRDHPTPEAGKDLVLLDTRQTEGGGDWSGHFVGTSFIFSHDAALSTLEGDPRFFFDDSQTPQAYGTGTEEWGGGGDYWGGLNMTLPLAGHPVGAKDAKAAVSAEDKINSAYQFLLADLMPFGKNAVIRLEHGAVNDSNEHYETVTYWYGLPAPSLVKTDELTVGDETSERLHRYWSPDASKPYEIVSRYEWGPDTLEGRLRASRSGEPRRSEAKAGREIYPPHADRGRITKTASEFTLTIDPNNVGVMLRRKLDYAFPNQRAEVYVSEATNKTPEWALAGTWYLAGSNTCVFSNPGDGNELGATQHVVQTSNRRFRDDEFLIPQRLTRGRSAIRVRVRFTPVRIPLYPGRPLPELAWSEMRYTAYSFVMPSFTFADVSRRRG
ncbi:MAG: DUF2961 domain-containing protein [Luteitalea sp.]|nr:DUF2961 domain-containing protein [Luteitalea sp.]